VEHHGVEAVFLELGEFPVESLGRAHGRAVGVLAFADVPRAEAEFVGGRCGHKKWREAGGRLRSKEVERR